MRQPPASPPVSSGEPLQPSSTSNSSCSPHICSWQPYTNSNDFQDNLAMVLIILFCALICSVVLNAVIRCFLGGVHRGGRRRTASSSEGSQLPQTQQELDQGKPVMEAGIERMVAAPTVVYSIGMKLERNGAEPECAICLSEFVEGEEIQVLAKCKHGFHVQCIQRWLTSHSSCPNCRCNCLPMSPSSEENINRCVRDGSQPVMPEGEP